MGEKLELLRCSMSDGKPRTVMQFSEIRWAESENNVDKPLRLCLHLRIGLRLHLRLRLRHLVKSEDRKLATSSIEGSDWRKAGTLITFRGPMGEN